MVYLVAILMFLCTAQALCDVPNSHHSVHITRSCVLSLPIEANRANLVLRSLQQHG
jgi:hypothetical protein